MRSKIVSNDIPTRLTVAFVVSLVSLLMVAESAQAKRIVGTNGPDRLVGTAKADKIKARRGDDRVKGRGGKDRLAGGPGADRLNARDGGPDRAVKGGPGKDICKVDAADLAKLKGCETAKVAGGGGPGQNCVTPPKEPRLPARAAHGDPPPPQFSDAFYAITITLNVSADGLTGDELPIAIEEVCDVPEQLAAEAAQLVGGDGMGIITGATRVFENGVELQGAAATTALGGADAMTLRAQLKRPAEWRQNEKGEAVPTFDVSRADITD
jgi:RTX calcium-binding nonapeptide repeat (4 copies)